MKMNPIKKWKTMKNTVTKNCGIVSVSFIHFDDLSFEFFQVVLNLGLLFAVFHCQSHDLFLVFPLELLFDLLQYLLVARVHENPFIFVSDVVLFQHLNPVFIPLLDGSQSLGRLLVLVDKVLFVLLPFM